MQNTKCCEKQIGDIFQVIYYINFIKCILGVIKTIRVLIILESFQVFDRRALGCSLFTEWDEIGAGLGSGSAGRVHGTSRYAAHRSNAAWYPTVLSVPDSHRGRASVHPQTDTAESTGAGGTAVRDSRR